MTEKIIRDHGAFFAFNDEQFAEQHTVGIKYVHMGAGLICPKNKADSLNTELIALRKKKIAEDIALNGKQAIIIRELYNYECTYTMDISDAVEALKGYGIAEEEVMVEFKKLE